MWTSSGPGRKIPMAGVSPAEDAGREVCPVERDQQSEQPVLNIVGEKVALGPHRRDLIPVYTRWINDFEVMRTLAMPMRPVTPEWEESWYDGLRTRENDTVFAIYERSTMRPIGSTGLHHIDYRHQTAQYGIMIGEKDAWGKGYGTEVTGLMLDYAFTGLGLHSVMLYTYSYNERGIRAYKRAGFKEVGRLRDAHRMGGRAYDVILMDCLSTEFSSPVLHRLLPDTDAGR